MKYFRNITTLFSFSFFNRNFLSFEFASTMYSVLIQNILHPQVIYVDIELFHMHMHNKSIVHFIAANKAKVEKI